VSADTQPTLFDAAAARDTAIARVDEHADHDWKTQALAAVRRTAEQLPEFIVDEVWATGRLESTREDRALGPIMRAAAREGWMVRTDRTRPSVRSHLSPKPVWRSLIHQGQERAA
jgi:hypothetical protein